MSTLPQPIGRLAFLVRFILAVAALVALDFVYEWSLSLIADKNHESLALILFLAAVWLVLFIFLTMCFIRFVIIARLVSLGLNRWYALLLLVPLVGFVLLLYLLFGSRVETPPKPAAP